MSTPRAVPLCVVVDRKTGDVLRYGYCDFERDGQFNPKTEVCRTDPASRNLVAQSGRLLQGKMKQWIEMQRSNAAPDAEIKKKPARPKGKRPVVGKKPSASKAKARPAKKKSSNKKRKK